MPLPKDYLERVYAGVLGKVIGVYLGRPFEGWPREKILSDLGHVRYYVHEKVAQIVSGTNKAPLIVTDDDVSGTFLALKALDEHGMQNLTPEAVGRTWLNNVVENRSVFWWGGKGVSTEHTAYLNLKHGTPGGKSGSIETNGKAIAEQIGGEIFIDALPMCTPGNTDLAASLAKAAASVSHDGESLYGAIMWAVMESQAFMTKDVDVLLDTGLSYIPDDCLIAKSVDDIRGWAKDDHSWEVTRDRIEEKYGNHKFPGACHVIPNHSIKILTLVYGGHSFHEAMHIIMTCGWDTDSNGGNVGALWGIMHGLKGFDDGPDWRGPLEDRVLISTADGGFSVNNCTRLAYHIVSFGRALAVEPPQEEPKNGSQFHFSLPGGVQGFHAEQDSLMPEAIKIKQARGPNGPALAIQVKGLSCANDPISIATDTFIPMETLAHSEYVLQACPLVYPGQELEVSVMIDKDFINSEGLLFSFLLRAYSSIESSITLKNAACSAKLGAETRLQFTIPDKFDHQPIHKVGLIISNNNPAPASGTIWLNYLRWDGSPKMILRQPKKQVGFGSEFDPWRRAWVNNASTFPPYFPNFMVSQSEGEGGIFQGCRDWYDYAVTAKHFINNMKGPNGLVVRMQGLRRWYGLMFKDDQVVLMKALDERRIVLASASFNWQLDMAYDLKIIARGWKLRGFIDGNEVVTAEDSQYASGGIGLVVTDGSVSVESFEMSD